MALGACAHLGGINAIRNRQDLDDVRAYVYDGNAHYFDAYRVRGIDEVINVDAVIPGCPIDRDEFVHVVRGLLQGRLPEPPNYAVCIECKLHENVCIFERGGICLGPITRAGCGAVCPTYGVGCDGCRGLIPYPKVASLRQVLAERGLDEAAIDAKLSIFLTNQIERLADLEEPHVA